jgi:hypothetical protein
VEYSSAPDLAPQWSHSPESWASPQGSPPAPITRADQGLLTGPLCAICESKPSAFQSAHCSICGGLHRHLMRLSKQPEAVAVSEGRAKRIIRRVHIALDCACDTGEAYSLGFARAEADFDWSQPQSARKFFTPTNIYIIPAGLPHGEEPQIEWLADGPDFRIWRSIQLRKLKIGDGPANRDYSFVWRRRSQRKLESDEQ